MQKVPRIDLIPHEGDMICGECNEEATFLIGPEPANDGIHRCKTCMTALRPEYADTLSDISNLLDLMLDMESRMVTQEMMHELYGNKKDE